MKTARLDYWIENSHTKTKATMVIKPAWWDALQIVGYINEDKREPTYTMCINKDQLTDAVLDMKEILSKKADSINDLAIKREMELKIELMDGAEEKLKSLGFTIE